MKLSVNIINSFSSVLPSGFCNRFCLQFELGIDELGQLAQRNLREGAEAGSHAIQNEFELFPTFEPVLLITEEHVVYRHSLSRSIGNLNEQLIETRF